MKMNIRRCLLMVALSIVTSGLHAAGGRLFHIARSLNKNIVCYDVQLSGHGLDTKSPINVYWHRNEEQQGLVKPLSAIERKLAYGYKVVKATEKEATVTLTAYGKREIKVSQRGGKWVATISINGKECQLSHIYVKAKGAMSVEYIELHGKTLNGNATQKETIKP